MTTHLHEFITAIAVVVSLAGATAHADPALEQANELLDRAILFDGHNDLPWAIREHPVAAGDLAKYDLVTRAPENGQTDIPRLRAGKVGAQFWSVYTPPEAAGGHARTQLEQIDLMRRIIAEHPETFTLCSTAADIRAAKKAGRIGSMFGIEGGHSIEDSLGALRAYYDLGVRYMTLTHNRHTNWADAGLEDPPRHDGLSAFGEEVVREMNRLGMLVDLSHTSVATMHDALRVSQAPVIYSHAAARAVTEIPRNVPDAVLLKLKDNGGVIMITFVSGFVSQDAADAMLPFLHEYLAKASGKSDEERRAIYKELRAKVVMPKVPVAAVADHIEHVRDLIGMDYIGIGGDFDGTTDLPVGLEDVSGYPVLFAELIRRGWKDAELEKLAGGNVLRALEQAEQVARRLQAAESRD